MAGAPGTGKTKLAADLARELGLPVIHRDTIKEALLDTIGADDRDTSHELGRVSYRILYALARVILESGNRLIIESNFVRGVSEADLSELLATGRTARLVHCQATNEAIKQRIASRAGRHPQHSDDPREVLEAIKRHDYDPMTLDVETLVVETTEGLVPDLPEIVAFCRRSLP